MHGVRVCLVARASRRAWGTARHLRLLHGLPLQHAKRAMACCFTAPTPSNERAVTICPFRLTHTPPPCHPTTPQLPSASWA